MNPTSTAERCVGPGWLSVACCLLVSVALATGCGYSVVGYRTGDEEAVRVSIDTLSNDTLEPGLELLVSEALRRTFLRAGRLRVVENPAAADFRLSGRVVEVLTAGRSFSQNVRALEFSVTLRLALDVETAHGSTPELGPIGLAETEIYLASADIEISRKNRDEALRRLARLLADRVYDEVQRLAERLVPPVAAQRAAREGSGAASGSP